MEGKYGALLNSDCVSYVKKRVNMTIKIQPEYWIFKYIWFIIFFPKPVQLLLLLMIGLTLNIQRKFKFDVISWLLLIILILRCVSISMNLIRFHDYAQERVLASFNTASLWLAAVLFYGWYVNNPVSMEQISKYCFVNSVIFFIVAIFSAAAFFMFSIENMVFLGKPILGSVYINGEKRTRFYGGNDYSNLAVFFIMFCFAYGFYRFKRKEWKIVWLLINFAAIYIIGSRSGIILFLFILLSELWREIGKKVRYSLMFLVVIFLLFNINKIVSWLFDSILYGNISSNNARMDIYVQSVVEVIQKSPFIGMGIKKYLYKWSVAPLGSHSTYIGLFYQIGIIGGIVGLLLFSIIAVGMVKRANRDKLIRIVLLFMLVLFAIEDIDGGNWLIVMYFSSVGICFNRGKKAV